MTVAELMTLLAQLPADLPVILSADPEGNFYSDVGFVSRFESDADGYGLEVGYSDFVVEDAVILSPI